MTIIWSSFKGKLQRFSRSDLTKI